MGGSAPGTLKQQTIKQTLAAAAAKAQQRTTLVCESQYEALVDQVQKNLTQVRQLEVESVTKGSQIEQTVHRAFTPPQPKWAEVFTELDSLYKKRQKLGKEKIDLIDKCKGLLGPAAIKVSQELSKLKADVVAAEKELALAQERHAKQQEKLLEKQKKKEKQGTNTGGADKKRKKQDNASDAIPLEVQQNKGRGGFDNLYKTIRVKWEENGQVSWFTGTVIGYEPLTNKHVIYYAESNEEENLELGVDIAHDEYHFLEAPTPQK